MQAAAVSSDNCFCHFFSLLFCNIFMPRHFLCDQRSESRGFQIFVKKVLNLFSLELDG